MAAKSQTTFVCKNCGYESQKWLGKCPSCNQWNSFKETTKLKASTKPQRQKIATRAKPLPLNKISHQKRPRIPVGLSEIDRILGGGLVPGQVVLISGEPGIGKSTLLLQLACHLAMTKSIAIVSKNVTAKILYLSGEESLNQIKIRAHRLGLKGKGLLLSNETQIEEALKQAQEVGANLLIIDSIQTVTTSLADSVAGSLSQVRESAGQIIAFAKKNQIPAFIVGHVTKEGVVAGPKTLEHMVDTVLELTGERFQNLRLLRTTKNRFGPVDELAVFKMSNKGLTEVKNPSALFLEEITSGQSGSCVAVLMEGTRPILVEIQALTVPTTLPVPRRIGTGIAPTRVALLCAILQKRVNLILSNQDVYVKVSGGLTVKEPGADLATALAIASSFKNKPLGKIVAIGEVGLLGEVRKVARLETRLKEARRLGFKTILSAKNSKGLKEAFDKLKMKNQKPKTQT